MPNQFENLAHPDNAEDAVPHDTNLLVNAGILYVGTGGNISLVTSQGNEVTFVGVLSGSFLPVLTRQVKNTGTTATDLVVLY